MTPQPAPVYVWDRFVRIFHWLLVAAFAVAFLSEDGPQALHLVAGFTIAGLVVARIAWGFIGPRHARFRDFVYAPQVVVGYLKDLVQLRGKRYLGHSPAGGASILLLLFGLLGTSVTGVLVLGVQQDWGPLAATPPAAERTLTAEPAGEAELAGEERESAAMERYEEWHEAFANFTLALATLHFAGVMLASFAHRENLAGAMVTGFKRP